MRQFAFNMDTLLRSMRTSLLYRCAVTQQGSAFEMARTVADIEKQIKKLKEQIRKRHEREARRVGKIADEAGLLEREISDEDLLKEFSAIAERFPKKA
ncbi:hypothetical protein FHW19_004517 [Ochrobactrum anthropi]|uniref:TraC family protein n=1 Tax=Brucella anthropi TaxID=529 RepID=UPI0015FB1E28|nr:TraC family protein [Brucella anthropi]MBA8862766.1 hypothetical protein [Brucella anthropi]